MSALYLLIAGSFSGSAQEAELSFNPEETPQAASTTRAEPIEDRQSADVADSVEAQIEALIAINEYAQAAELAAQRILMLEQQVGRFDLRLARPLVLLGHAEKELGAYEHAITFYERAREIQRQNSGLHDLSQVEVLYSEAEAFRSQGNLRRANDRHEYAYSLYLRQHGFESVHQLPGLFRLADWYVSTYNVFAARGLYERAHEIGKTHLHEHDPQLLSALRGIVRTYKMEKFRPSLIPQAIKEMNPRPYGSVNSPHHYFAVVNDFAPGETALIDIVRIQMARPGTTRAEVAHAKLELADWYSLFEKHEKARVVYEDVWSMFVDSSDSTFLQSEFAEPKMLYMPLPMRTFMEPEEGLETAQGRIKLAFTVTDKGTTQNIKTVSSEPGGLRETDIRSGAKRARYRPAFVDGKPIETEGVSYVYEFIYHPADS